MHAMHPQRKEGKKMKPREIDHIPSRFALLCFACLCFLLCFLLFLCGEDTFDSLPMCPYTHAHTHFVSVSFSFLIVQRKKEEEQAVTMHWVNKYYEHEQRHGHEYEHGIRGSSLAVFSL